jgi:hypothetical protein
MVNSECDVMADSLHLSLNGLSNCFKSDNHNSIFQWGPTLTSYG